MAATLLALGALALLAGGCMADTPPPAAGNWTVDDVTLVDGRDIVLDGSLEVRPGGRLSLSNLTLTVQGRWDGDRGIHVHGGARLGLENVSVRSSHPDRHYWFEVHGSAVFERCDVRDVASETHDWHWYWAYHFRGGVQVYNSSVVLSNSSFHDSQRVNVQVTNSTPAIINCSFYNAEYNRYREVYQYCPSLYGEAYCHYADAAGLILRGSDARVTGCSFYHNGLASGALRFYNGSYYRNAVVTYGSGLLAVRSSPEVTACDFQLNGLRPADRYVDGTHQLFLDHLRSRDDIYKGGLVCLWDGAHPIVRGCTFANNDIFGVCGLLGGYPSLVDGCNVSGTSAQRDYDVLSPSAGIYVEGGDGRLRVTNTTLSHNAVATDISVRGPDVTLYNVSTLVAVLDAGDNVLLGAGDHLIDSCRLDGSPFRDSNLRLDDWTQWSDSIELRVVKTMLVGGRYGFSVTPSRRADVHMSNTTMKGHTQSEFWLNSASVDCLDCTFDELDIRGSSYALPSTLTVRYHLGAQVDWQSGAPVRNASVLVEDPHGMTVAGGLTGDTGSYGPAGTLNATYTLEGGLLTVRHHAPLNITVHKGGATHVRRGVPFGRSTNLDITLYETTPPSIAVAGPREGLMTADPEVTFRGECMDILSGMASVLVSLDGSDWEVVGVSEWCVTYRLGDGVHHLAVRALDRAGNVAEARVGNITVDTVRPYIDITDPPSDRRFINQSLFRVFGRTEPNATVRVDGRQVPCVDGTFEALLDIPVEGPRTVRVAVRDQAGNENETLLTVVRDTVPPVVRCSELPNITMSPQVDLHVGAFDLNFRRLSVEGVAHENASVNATLDLREGENVVVVRAEDLAGNVVVITRTVVLDTRPPTILFHSPLPGSLIEGTHVTFRGHVDEEVTVLELDGEPLEPVDGAFERTLRLEEGENALMVLAVDLAGNVAEEEIVVHVDTLPPSVHVSSPLDGAVLADGLVTVAGTVDDAEEVMVNGLSVVVLQGRFQHSLELPETSPGGDPRLITIEAEDEAGHRTVLHLRVWVDSTAPAFDLLVVPQRTRDRQIALHGQLLDPGERVELTVNGIGFPVSPNGTFLAPVTLATGRNVITVQVMDEAGNVASQEVLVRRLPEKSGEDRDGATLVALAALSAMVGVALVLVARTMRRRRD